MHVFDNIAPLNVLAPYSQYIERFYLDRVSQGADPRSFQESRRLVITNDSIIDLSKKIIEEKLKVRLTLESAELTCWPPGSISELHVHDDKGRHTTDYNSILYLNDNFRGGEFYTSDGIIIFPRPGRLTFFDGSKVYHGVKPVLSGYRNTVTFWWCNTKLDN